MAIDLLERSYQFDLGVFEASLDHVARAAREGVLLAGGNDCGENIAQANIDRAAGHFTLRGAA